ncbi:MAG: family 16 glycosylhydrolase, partial [bacterium]|nr:family 16 glycosylhydrolase [bacterium]
MRYLLVLSVTLLMGFSTSPAGATWSLVWSDEFNGTSLDTNDWNYAIGTGCPDLCGWGNNELEYYRSQNVSLENGNLKITAKNEYYGGMSFTSGRINTQYKHSFLYGRFEARAKIPTGNGMWPAFWMMPEDDVYGGWAASGEIDIMESANNTTSVGGALHFGGNWPNNTHTSESYSLGGANFADEFHIYAVEWEADEIRWYVDDVLFMTRHSSQWYSDAAPGNPQAPFDQEFYIILNTAVGGNYTGCLEPGCITDNLPQDFLLDYVRVYENIENQLPTVVITTPVSGSTLPAGNIHIQADASDADGSVERVEFYNGSTLLGQDDAPPYEIIWQNADNGCYELKARVIDNQGGTAESTVDVTVGSGCGQAPYFGQPITLPAVVQAENYDLGGQGVAYQDSDPGNNGGQYRLSEDVDIESCSDAGSGYNVGWTMPGEWVEYTIEVPVSGQYDLDIRLASMFPNRNFHLEFNRVDKTGELEVPHTGSWQNWETLSVTVDLDAGLQTMRFVPGTEHINLNYFEF